MRQGVLIGAAALAVGAGSSVSFGQMFDTIINIGTGQADGTRYDAQVSSGTQLNIYDGGSTGSMFSVGIFDQTVSNAEVNLFGGRAGNSFEGVDVYNGATLNTFAGTLEGGVSIFAGGRVEARGAEFRERTNVYSGAELNATSGLFRNGIYVYEARATFAGSVEVFGQSRIFPGATVDVTGGFLQDFVIARGTSTRVTGGFMNIALSAFGFPSEDSTSVTIEGDAEIGSFWSDFGATVHVNGGQFLSDTQFSGTLDVTGGTFVQQVELNTNTISNITGGVFERGIEFERNVVAVVSGGLIAEGFQADAGSSVNLIGTEFFINGVEIDIEIGQTLEITRRAAFLTGLLGDGSAFDIGLRLNPQNGLDFVSRDATLTITRVVPAPGVIGLAGVVGLFAGRRRR